MGAMKGFVRIFLVFSFAMFFQVPRFAGPIITKLTRVLPGLTRMQLDMELEVVLMLDGFTTRRTLV